MIRKSNLTLTMLGALNTVAETYIIGRSLISNSSKDIDFMVIGNKEDFDKISELSCVKPFKNRYNKDNEYTSEDFPWCSIISGKNDEFKFDILFCDFLNDIHSIIDGFPITKQHIAYRKDILIHGKYFTEDRLELSPKRRQKTLSDGLKKVMEKYCGYYPDDRIGVEFLEVLKEFAFESLKNKEQPTAMQFIKKG